MKLINEKEITQILDSYHINRKKASTEVMGLSGLLTSLEKAINASDISKKEECKICYGSLLDIYKFASLYGHVYNKIDPHNKDIHEVLIDSIGNEFNANKISNYFSTVMKIPQNDFKNEICAVKAISKYIKNNLSARSFENCCEKNVVYVSELFNHILNIKNVKHQNI